MIRLVCRGITRGLPRCCIGLVVAGSLLLSGCATVSESLRAPQVELVTIQPQSLRGGRTLFALTRLRVSNPNTIPLPIAGGQVNMRLAGQPVAAGELTEGFTLPASGSEEIDIRIGLDLASALTVGMTLLDDNTELPYEIDGYIDVGISYLGRVPLAEEGVVAVGQLRPPE